MTSRLGATAKGVLCARRLGKRGLCKKDSRMPDGLLAVDPSLQTVNGRKMNLADFRKEYSEVGLHRKDLKADPVAQFASWFAQAVECGLHEPNAMTLGTVGAGGMPFQRTVLLKFFDASGFVFFTNYGSRKARQIEANPQVCLLFPWIPMERQVVIQGRAERISTADSLRYFASRPRESQIGAWVSDQSEVITSRKFLLQKLAEIREKFHEGDIPLPSFWGGYRIVPSTMEFWQGGPARLHDRFMYDKTADGWAIDRLSP
jgi:pyridoxamine 5'-phosphate oxidase